MGYTVMCHMTHSCVVVGLRRCCCSVALLLALSGVGAFAAELASEDEVDALMRAGGVYLDVDELSHQLVGEIESEISQLDPGQSMSNAEQQATLRAARRAFDSDRMDVVIQDVLEANLSTEDVADRLDAYSTEFGRHLIAIEFTEKRRAPGPEYQADVDAFESGEAFAWRRDAITDMYRRHDVASDQARMYIDTQIAVLTGLSGAVPALDSDMIARMENALLDRHSEFEEVFAASGVGFTGWLYRDLDDAAFIRAMRFNDSLSARRVHIALMAGYREAIVSGGLIYGREVVRELRAAKSLVEI